jgi:PAS domain S-box-containing protein
MEDHYKQEALRSEKRRLETEVSVPTGEIPDLRFQLDSRNSRLEEDEEFLKLLLECFNGIFFKGTVDGKTFSLSGDFEKITGYSRNEIAFDANTWTSLIHPEDLNSVEDEINQLTYVPGVAMKREFRIVRKDGELRWVNVFAHSSKSRGLESILIQAAMFDISGRKEEEALAISKEKRKALEETAGGIAHNFNNILQVILSGAQLIKSDLSAGAGNLSEVSEVLELILKNCRIGAQIVKRLGVFAGTIQDYARLNYELFDLADAARSALAYIEDWRANGYAGPGELIKFHMDIENDLYVSGSKNEMSRVISVLIKNAFESIQSTGNISLAVRSDADTAILEVSDSGVGVKQDHQEKIFTPFFSTKTSVGSGLGLPVAMKIVEDHGGRITFRSLETQGSVFRIQLPKVCPVFEGNIIPASQMTLGTKKILLIDDDKTVLNFLRKRIKRLGYDVYDANSAFEGLRKFKDESVDVIVCDLALPGMNGLGIAREIKQICLANDIVKPLFIILTGWNVDPSKKDKFLEFGIDEILQKPVDISRIISIIDSAIPPTQRSQLLQSTDPVH